jgi:hypothetical protein
MKHYRSLGSLIGFCLLAVLGSALAFALIVTGGSVALASHQNSDEMQNAAPLVPNSPTGTIFKGMVTDSRCGARHLRNSGMSPAECARACVRKGASYVLVDGERRYTLTGNEDVLQKLVGTRASVTGTRQGDSIVVNAAASAPF